jgi:hypothetical protein
MEANIIDSLKQLLNVSHMASLIQLIYSKATDLPLAALH